MILFRSMKSVAQIVPPASSSSHFTLSTSLTTMKLSLKFPNHDQHHHHHTTQIMTAKLPITIFNNPFISSITATTTATPDSTSDFNFSLSTNFPSGPSFKLSYSPTTTSFPFSLSLKSGLGLFGSPHHSPLVFSANFSLSPSHQPLPSFFLHFKPQFGHFSLNKTVFSEPIINPVPNSLPNDVSEGEKGFGENGSSSSSWQELKLEPCGVGENNSGFANDDARYGLSPDVAVMARTVVPVTKGVLLNLRWGVNFPGESKLEFRMPYLTVNKIGLERVEEVKESSKKQSVDSSEGDLQILKGVCFWTRRDLENVERENRELKKVLDDMKMGVSTRNGNGGGVGKKLGESSVGDFQRWRSNKNGKEENEKKQVNKSQSVVSDVESELQKAIKAAASSS